MTEAQLQRIVDRWSARLDLGWTVKAKFVSQAALAEVHGNRWKIYADCTRDPHKRKAVLRISRFEDLPEGLAAIHETVLHELGHILFDPTGILDNDSSFEVGLDKYASAMTKAYYRKRKRQ